MRSDDHLKQTETIEIPDVEISISDSRYAKQRMNAYQILSAEKKMHGQQALDAVKTYLAMAEYLGELKDKLAKIRQSKINRDKEVQSALDNMQRLAFHISSEEARTEAMLNTGMLPRLKKNLSFQLGNLADKCTSEQLLKLENGLSQLQSVFDGVQLELRDELMEHGTQASLLQPHSTEQQRILRSTRGDINAVLEAAQGVKNPSHNLLRSTVDIQPRSVKTPSVSPKPDYNPDDYWWNKY